MRVVDSGKKRSCEVLWESARRLGASWAVQLMPHARTAAVSLSQGCLHQDFRIVAIAAYYQYYSESVLANATQDGSSNVRAAWNF
eukprot:3717346-Rhodomonas_salina.2